MQETVVQIEDLVVRYRDKQALDGLTLFVKRSANRPDGIRRKIGELVLELAL